MSCPPCNHACSEGRDCPPVPASAFVTNDGGESVNGSIAIQLHRQLMPPEPKPDPEAGYERGLWLVWAACALIFAIFTFAVIVSANPSLL